MDTLSYLTEELIKIIKVYIAEFGKFINERHLHFLSNESNLKKVLQFSDKSTGAWCVAHKQICFGSNTSHFINQLRQNPLYGTQPNHILVTRENFVDNTLDYWDYVNHFILIGGNELDFYLDLLPHEAMHLIGISGGVIGEGVTEKRTREICLKHNIRSAPISHGKEVKLVSLMEKLVGKEILTKTGFEDNFFQYWDIEKALDKKCGSGTFERIYSTTQIPYGEKYLKVRYANPFEKFNAYKNLNFEPAYSLLLEHIV